MCDVLFSISETCLLSPLEQVHTYANTHTLAKGSLHKDREEICSPPAINLHCIQPDMTITEYTLLQQIILNYPSAIYLEKVSKMTKMYGKTKQNHHE